MTDPLGLIGRESGIGPLRKPGESGGIGPLRAGKGGGADGVGSGDFKKMMLDQLKEVNNLDREATQAIEDFESGKRTDFEMVMRATRKSDIATQMLLQLRNKVMTAFDEVKQIRV